MLRAPEASLASVRLRPDNDVDEIEPEVTTTGEDEFNAAPVNLFVTGALAKTFKLPDTWAEGLPPEHASWRSPTRSVNPSTRTSGGLAEGTQVKTLICADRLAHPIIVESRIAKRAITDLRKQRDGTRVQDEGHLWDVTLGNKVTLFAR